MARNFSRFLLVFSLLFSPSLSALRAEPPDFSDLPKPHFVSASGSSQSQNGPYFHSIHAASSLNGITFTPDSAAPIAEHASVPSALQFPDGAVRVYFVDSSDLSRGEQLGCLESRDGGTTFTEVPCLITGAKQPLRAVDFCAVLTYENRTRLYFYEVEGRIDERSLHKISSAVSDDGLTFEYEGPVFEAPGLVDPDVFWNGDQWILHVFSLSSMKTVVAVSNDGTSFDDYGYLEPAGYGVTKPVKLPDGVLRMYGFKQPQADHFVSFTSLDGLRWAQEQGIRMKIPEGFTGTDPFVIQLLDGSYKMFYKLEKARNTHPRPRGRVSWN